MGFPGWGDAVIWVFYKMAKKIPQALKMFCHHYFFDKLSKTF